MSKKNHQSGGKVTKPHTTSIDAAQSIVQFGNKHPAVKRVGLGIITPGLGSTSAQRVKIKREPGCLKLQVRGGSSAQEILFFTDSPEFVENQLKEKLSRKYHFV